MKKITVFITVCMLAMSVFGGFVYAEGEDIIDFRFAIEYVYADGQLIIQCEAVNGSSPYTFFQEVVFSEWLSVGGWMANDEGIAKLQYTVDGENWFDTENPKFHKRADLKGAGIPYENGHDTAGFGVGTNLIPASAITEDNCILNIRAVTLEGNYVEFIQFEDVSVVDPGEAAPVELIYNTYLDDVTDGHKDNPQGVNSPTYATIETDSGKPVAIRGWAVSNYGISKVVYTIDGGDYIDDVPGPYVSREDVMNAYPVYTAQMGNTDHVGYGKPGNFLTLPKTAELTAGIYTVDVYGVSADGTKYFKICELAYVVDGGGDLIPAATPTEEPAEPTEAPVVIGEPEVTDVPSVTEAPTPEAPAATAGNSSKTQTKGCGGIIMSHSVAALALAAAVLIKKKGSRH